MYMPVDKGADRERLQDASSILEIIGDLIQQGKRERRYILMGGDWNACLGASQADDVVNRRYK